MEYVREPWTAREIPPQVYKEVASHRIKDAFGTLIATIKAPYIPAPDTPTVEAHLNMWRNTARLIKYAPEMYTLLKKLQEELPENDSSYLLVQDMIDKVEGKVTELDILLQELKQGD